MINIELSKKKFWDNKTESYVFLLEENFAVSSELKELQDKHYPHIKEILKKHGFEGKTGQSYVLTDKQNGKLVSFVFIGVGSLKDEWDGALESLRRSVGKFIELLKKLHIGSATLGLQERKEYGITLPELAYNFSLAAHLADYEFTEFKSDKNKKEFQCKLVLSFQNSSFKVEQAISDAFIVGEATNLARYWSDLPANMLTPTSLADKARKASEKLGIKFTAFGRDKAEKLGMGGFCAVDSGSEQDGKFIILEYKSKSKKAPTIALVGKGVTFDTGGVSLKPSQHMTGMKFDMSGAASVIATIVAAAKLNLNCNVVALAPAVENMPSGRSDRQDDIIRFFNGKTAEIKNTDAEGRLILADALAYAEKQYKPDIMIDVATLTGAVVVALGHFFTGLMTRDEKLASQLHDIGRLTGDRTWRLPLADDFKAAIKSDVADLANVGSPSYGGGTITAALFLENFVDKARWVHLDIAGSSHEVPGICYMGKGASGASVRLLVEFLKQTAKPLHSS